jgi:rod shape determining protein RodA
MLLFLLIVLFAAPNTRGAARWIHLPIPGMDFKLQPSEFAKICLLLTLSNYVAYLGARIREPVTLAKTLVHVGVPMLLIMKQPDLGTSLVFLAIWFGIVFLAGAKWQHLVLLFVAGIALFAFAWHANLLRPFQKDRVRTFVNPLRDPQGKGYHILQAETAIGGGGLSGQGWKQGMQTNGHFIPENHTDFVFTVVGEEAGFVGACALLGLYGVLLYRGVRIVAECEDSAGRLIAGGVTIQFAFHVIVNVGMNCGIMPVVGVPLPLVSFGGSATWANLAAIGLLLGVHRNRRRFHF